MTHFRVVTHKQSSERVAHEISSSLKNFVIRGTNFPFVLDTLPCPPIVLDVMLIDRATVENNERYSS